MNRTFSVYVSDECGAVVIHNNHMGINVECGCGDMRLAAMTYTGNDRASAAVGDYFAGYIDRDEMLRRVAASNAG